MENRFRNTEEGEGGALFIQGQTQSQASGVVSTYSTTYLLSTLGSEMFVTAMHMNLSELKHEVRHFLTEIRSLLRLTLTIRHM